MRINLFSWVVSGMVLAVALPSFGQDAIDATTMDGKVMFGYQGWFACEGDGSDYGWNHWFRNSDPKASNLRIDMWPDLSEFDEDELFNTRLNMPDGSRAQLYSAYTAKTVDRHFKWMKDYALDGVYLQRFISNIMRGGTRTRFRDEVTRNVMAGAENHGRVWAMMYDISGASSPGFVDALKKDWKHLVDDLKILKSPNYLHHKGKPVMAIWGLGHHTRPGSPSQAMDLINHFKKEVEEKYQVTLIGGTPARWRGLGSDSKKDKAWNDVYLSFDVLMPWTIGRYRTNDQVNAWMEEYTKPDMALLEKNGAEYMPVIFPGFSRSNMHIDEEPKDILNSIPRNGGRFIWHQAYQT